MSVLLVTDDADDEISPYEYLYQQINVYQSEFNFIDYFINCNRSGEFSLFKILSSSLSTRATMSSEIVANLDVQFAVTSKSNSLAYCFSFLILVENGLDICVERIFNIFNSFRKRSTMFPGRSFIDKTNLFSNLSSTQIPVDDRQRHSRGNLFSTVLFDN